MSIADPELDAAVQGWERKWSTVGFDVSRLKGADAEQFALFERALRGEEARLFQQYNAVDLQASKVWSTQREKIEKTFTEADKKLSSLPKSASVSTLDDIIRDIWEKRIPWSELSTPTDASKNIRAALADFRQQFVRYRLLQQHPVTNDNKRQSTGKLDELRYKTLEDELRKRQEGHGTLKHEQIDELTTGMRRSVATFQIELRNLKRDILTAVKLKVDQQREYQRSVIEQGTRIPGLRRQLDKFRALTKGEELKLQRAKSLANEDLDRLRNRYRLATEKLVEQEQLIDDTRSIGKDVELPAPGAHDFAKQIGQRFANLRMAAADVSMGSGCDNLSDGLSLKPYQQLLPELLEPDKLYRGFIADHGTGSGKTGLGCNSMLRWFAKQIQMFGDAGPAIMVLLPKVELFNNWNDSISKWIGVYDPDGGSMVGDNTMVVTLRAIKGVIVLHKLTVVLPEKVERLIRKTLREGQTMIINKGYALSAYDYNTHPAYTPLSLAEKALLNEALKAQKEIIKGRRTAIPSHGLIIVDEAHNLVNSQEIARDAFASCTALAWTNTIILASEAKLLLETATPLLDDAKLSDLFKLLNLTIPAVRHKIFDGTYRRTFAEKEAEDVKEAATHADECETKYVESLFFEARDGSWKPEQKQKLVNTYAGVLSYLTLENDPTVYPSFTSDCAAAPDTCTFRWSGSAIAPINSDQLAQTGLPKPKVGRNVLVPMTTKQYKSLKLAMASDLKRWKRTRRLNAPIDSPNVSQINYSASERVAKSSLLTSRGTRTYVQRGVVEWAPKAEVLLYLLKLHPNDKFFAYTASSDQFFANKMTDFFRQRAKFEVLDIATGVRFIRGDAAVYQEPSIKQLKDKWFEANAASKGKGKVRVMMYIASAKAKEGVSPGLLNRVRDFLLAVFNDDRNINGEFVQAFIGDRSTKEGISLLHTMHGVMLDGAVSPSMDEQSRSRILRNCSMRLFPLDRWSKVILWRLLSVPPPGQNDKTNEEWQYIYLSERKSASTQLIGALEDSSLDSYLFCAYNKKPCPQERNDKEQNSGDQFCDATGALLIKDANSPVLTEVLETAVGSIPQSNSSDLAALCGRAAGTIRDIPGPSYRDALAQNAIDTPPDPALVSFVRQGAVNRLQKSGQIANVNVGLVKEVLLGIGAYGSKPLKDDLDLWAKAGSLSPTHKAALRNLLAHRLSRLDPGATSQASLMVGQVVAWMQRKLVQELARRDLLLFLK